MSTTSPDSSNNNETVSTPVDYTIFFFNRSKFRGFGIAAEIWILCLALFLINISVKIVSAIEENTTPDELANWVINTAVAISVCSVFLYQALHISSTARKPTLEKLLKIQDDMKLHESFSRTVIKHLEKGREGSSYEDVTLKLKDGSEVRLAFSPTKHTFTVISSKKET